MKIIDKSLDFYIPFKELSHTDIFEVCGNTYMKLVCSYDTMNCGVINAINITTSCAASIDEDGRVKFLPTELIIKK